MTAPLKIIAGAAALLFAAACEYTQPSAQKVTLTFYAPEGYPWAYAPRNTATPPVCSVRIGEVADVSADMSMGHLGDIPLRGDDKIGWLRSGFEMLALDKRFAMTDTADTGDGFVLNVTLLKSYLESHTTSKSSTVVVRVGYVRAGEPAGEKTFRGDQTDINWTGGMNEASDSLNRALREVIAQAHDDLLARCLKPAAPIQAVAAVGSR